jgi:hypothetical protein
LAKHSKLFAELPLFELFCFAAIWRKIEMARKMEMAGDM